MASSKTANALMTKFNYEEKGYKVVLLKPSIDDRDGLTKVRSRIGLEAEAICVNKDNDIIQLLISEPHKYVFNQSGAKNNIDCIIIDECQFLSVAQVENLKYISDYYDTPVFCYGLRTDFQTNLFDASKRLFEIADSITEIKSICHCGNKAIVNARYKENKIIYEGSQIDIGGDDKYIGLCYRCWKEGRLNLKR